CMATTLPATALTPYPRSLLAGLRWRIRLYVWLEGLAVAVIWLGLMFWLSLGLDYLPVVVGASEMPAAARGVLLAATGIVLAWLFYQFVLRRTFVRLADRSMALLLERKYTGFHDSLVTAVEMSQVPAHASHFSRDLLAKTADEAFDGAAEVRYRRVINYGRLNLRLLSAVLVAGTVAAFWVTDRQAFATATSRLYLLSDQPWPRSAHIEVEGIEVLRAAVPGQEAPPVTLTFGPERILKVAKGSNVRLKVRAAMAPAAKVVPQQCTIYYHEVQAEDGSRGKRGSVPMSSFRDAEGFRHFWFENKPFKGVLSTIVFDVVGYDHRASGYRLEVVESPAVVETLVDLEYPPYMVDEATSNFLPVTGQRYLPAGTFVPLGTKVSLHFRSSKPLVRAEIVATDTLARTVIDVDATGASDDRFSYTIPALKNSLTLEISLQDRDGVATERPYRVFLTGVEDQPPQIDARLRGIGSAVTPDVAIPVRGKVSDDYAVAKAWFDIQVNDSGDPQKREFALGKAGAVDQTVDFRDERSQPGGLEIKPGDKLFVALKASDKYDLAPEPHVGSGDRYELDVVTPEQLLAQLEVREVGLRRRFELIIDEMTQMRDSLLRVKASLSPGAAASAEPEDLRDDEGGQPLTPQKKAERVASLRLLRAQRAVQQSLKSVEEVRGVAAGFLDIRDELINNRVDTEDRKNRLKEQIADPLNRTCADEFPLLDQRLAAIETTLRETASAQAADIMAAEKSAAEKGAPLADESIEQANVVLSQLEGVLAKMQDLETYNELLEIVRDLLNDQGKLIDQTQLERKRQTLEELK
ncbi:MAG TPA: hypothetical protein VFV87_18210, partial [Pirellulaceae bacterium]|nr:hypothetical protein [Pirellulaceae bacterium]